METPFQNSQKKFGTFYKAEVELFALQETLQCPLYFSLTHPAPLGLDTMAHTWPRLHHYKFPLIALLTSPYKCFSTRVLPLTDNTSLADQGLVLRHDIPP